MYPRAKWRSTCQRCHPGSHVSPRDAIGVGAPADRLSSGSAAGHSPRRDPRLHRGPPAWPNDRTGEGPRVMSSCAWCQPCCIALGHPPSVRGRRRNCDQAACLVFRSCCGRAVRKRLCTAARGRGVPSRRSLSVPPAGAGAFAATGASRRPTGSGATPKRHPPLQSLATVPKPNQAAAATCCVSTTSCPHFQHPSESRAVFSPTSSAASTTPPHGQPFRPWRCPAPSPCRTLSAPQANSAWLLFSSTPLSNAWTRR